MSLAMLAPAEAHDAVLSTDPLDGATLRHQPAAVVLTLAEPPVALGTEIELIGPGGQVLGGATSIEGDIVRHAVPVDALPGSYQARWRVTADDGHTVSGVLHYTVAAAAGPVPGASAVPGTGTASGARTGVSAASPGTGTSSTARDGGAGSAASGSASSGGTGTSVSTGSGDTDGDTDGLPVAALLAVSLLVVALLAGGTWWWRGRHRDRTSGDGS